MNLIRFRTIVFSLHSAWLDQVIVSAVLAEFELTLNKYKQKTSGYLEREGGSERERNCDSHWRKLLTFLLSVEGWCFKNNRHLLLPHINPNLMLCNPIRRERSTHGMFTFSGPLEDQKLLPSFQGVPCVPDLLQQRTFTVFRVSLLQQLYQFLGTGTDYKVWPTPRSWCAETLAGTWKLACPKSGRVCVRGKGKYMDS